MSNSSDNIPGDKYQPSQHVGVKQIKVRSKLRKKFIKCANYQEEGIVKNIFWRWSKKNGGVEGVIYPNHFNDHDNKMVMFFEKLGVSL
jgi:hypothetical protein